MTILSRLFYAACDNGGIHKSVGVEVHRERRESWPFSGRAAGDGRYRNSTTQQYKTTCQPEFDRLSYPPALSLKKGRGVRLQQVGMIVGCESYFSLAGEGAGYNFRVSL